MPNDDEEPIKASAGVGPARDAATAEHSKDAACDVANVPDVSINVEDTNPPKNHNSLNEVEPIAETASKKSILDGIGMTAKTNKSAFANIDALSKMNNPFGSADTIAKLMGNKNTFANIDALSKMNRPFFSADAIAKLMGNKNAFANFDVLSKMNKPFGSADTIAKLMSNKNAFASIDALSKMNNPFGSADAIAKLMGNKNAFANIVALSRMNMPFGSADAIAKLMGNKSAFANIDALNRMKSPFGASDAVAILIGNKSAFSSVDAISRLIAAKSSFAGVDAVSKLMGVTGSFSANAALRRAMRQGAVVDWSATLAAISTAANFPAEVASLNVELDGLSFDSFGAEADAEAPIADTIGRICDQLIGLLRSARNPLELQSLKRLIESILLPLLYAWIFAWFFACSDDQHVDLAVVAIKKDTQTLIEEQKKESAEQAYMQKGDKLRLEEKIDELTRLLHEQPHIIDRIYVVRRAVPLCATTKFNGYRIATLLPGEEVELIERSKKWVFVRALSASGNFEEGWIMKKYLLRRR